MSFNIIISLMCVRTRVYMCTSFYFLNCTNTFTVNRDLSYLSVAGEENRTHLSPIMTLGESLDTSP